LIIVALLIIQSVSPYHLKDSILMLKPRDERRKNSSRQILLLY